MGENRSAQGWAIITGASSGMGLVFARELAGRGYDVLAVARRRDRLEALARDESSRGGRILPFTADLGTSDGLGALAARVRELGNIELLVNNAGVATAGNFADSDLGRELAEIGLNVNAVVALTHAVLAEMRPRKRGVIINVASVVAFNRFPTSRSMRPAKRSFFPLLRPWPRSLRGPDCASWRSAQERRKPR